MKVRVRSAWRGAVCALAWLGASCWLVPPAGAQSGGEDRASLRKRLGVQIQRRAQLSSLQQRALAQSVDRLAAGSDRDQQAVMDAVMSTLDSGCQGACLVETVGAMQRTRARGLDLVSALMLVGGALREVQRDLDRAQLSLSSLRDADVRERLRGHIDDRLALRERLGMQIQKRAQLSADTQLALAQPLDLFVASGGERAQLMGVVMTALGSGCEGMCLAESVNALNRAHLRGGLTHDRAARLVGGALRELASRPRDDGANADARRGARLRERVDERLGLTR